MKRRKGLIAGIAAARRPGKISSLVLMSPAFLISDAIHEQFDSLEKVPDRFQFNWITAGRPYAEDMWDYDVYEEIGKLHRYRHPSAWQRL
ncbi:MAG TPA: hypothetical protein IAC82_01190 [Candidatus Merdivicinus intestinigallinarum]|nr:hypothetical protein [Candidatus Merdivicinus intestinigallinarum]